MPVPSTETDSGFIFTCLEHIFSTSSPASAPRHLPNHIAAAFCAMTDVAAKTADALLTAMDAEEPFQLLRTLPGRLRELCEVERQRVDSEVRESTPFLVSVSK